MTKTLCFSYSFFGLFLFSYFCFLSLFNFPLNGKSVITTAEYHQSTPGDIAVILLYAFETFQKAKNCQRKQKTKKLGYENERKDLE